MWNKIKMFFINLFEEKKDGGIVPVKPTIENPNPVEPLLLAYPAKPTAKDIKKRTLYYYGRLWFTMIIKEKYNIVIEAAVLRIKNRGNFYKRAEKLTGVDWRIIGILHYMESGCKASTQILNGQRWDRKTTLAPAGYGPWGSFSESCIDAFERHPFKKDMTISEILKQMERYNGRGYIKKGINSPYLWSFTNNYKSGKFVEKKILFKYVSIYKKNLISRQVGAAVLLKELGF